MEEGLLGSGAKGVEFLDQQIQDLTLGFGLIEDVTAKVSENLESVIDGLDVSEAFRDGNEEIRQLRAELEELNKELAAALEAGDDQRVQLTKKRIREVTDALNQALGIRKQTLDDALDKEKEVNADGVKDFEDSEKKKTKALMTSNF